MGTVHVLGRKEYERLVSDFCFMKRDDENHIYENDFTCCLQKNFQNYHSLSFDLCFKFFIPKVSDVMAKCG